MVQAVVHIDDRINRVLNIIKAKYGLKDKSEAISLVVSKYEESFLEPELRPEYVEKVKEIESKGKFKQYSTLDALKAEIENA